MSRYSAIDAVVVGAGPNGLAAAVTLAREGLSVQVYEKLDDVGGAYRTEVWGDGFRSDWGAAVHPMALASPFFSSIRLADHLKFFRPDVSVAHPLQGSAALAWKSLVKRPGFVGGSRVTDGEWSHAPTPEQGTPVIG